MTTPLDIKKLLGARMVGAAGEELGSIEQVFFDDATGVQEWARLRMGGMLGGKDRFVPLFGGAMNGKDMKVPYDKQRVKDSPELVVDRHITPEQEGRLRKYYGLGDVGGTDSDRTTTTTTTSTTGKATTAAAAGIATTAGAAGHPAGTRAKGPTDARTGARTGEAAQGMREVGRDEAWLERFEERIGFRTEEVETGRVRLHKYVDVVPVEERVRLMHEEFELERMPITEGRGDFKEDHVEVVLRGQQAFAVKDIVPIERVRLNIRQVPQERVMRDEIRRERIEVERIEATRGSRSGDLAGRPDDLSGKARHSADKGGDVLGGAKEALNDGMGKVKGMFDGR
ncbi:MAG: YsnF/AvaK domain-containing protein [Streptosporangiaceae bacterium]